MPRFENNFGFIGKTGLISLKNIKVGNKSFFSWLLGLQSCSSMEKTLETVVLSRLKASYDGFQDLLHYLGTTL
jgi:hypothetical protein